MAYATLTDLQAAKSDTILKQLCEVTTLTPVPAAITAALAKADAVIDSYASKVYVTPVSPVPALLTAIAVDLALVALFGRNSQRQTPEDNEKSHQESIDLLKKIAAGDIEIPGATAKTSNFAGAPHVKAVAYPDGYDAPRCGEQTLGPLATHY